MANSPSIEAVISAVLAFISADSWAERKRIVEEQSHLLLTSAADQVLAELLEQYKEDANASRMIIERSNLLVRCRQEGIDAAFADRLRSSQSSSDPASYLRLLLNEIPRLTRPTDMPRRIEVCRQALTLVAREVQPELWAALQVELGNSLTQNPLGERADNLEKAIRNYTQALTVYTRQAFPEKWAATMNNLAVAYLYRIRGERAENLEEAIRHYTQVLTVCTRQAFPTDWAMTMNNLALAYSERIRGERADNLEEAIRNYRQALTVYTRQAFPEQWTTTINNLAIAYKNRIRGERADNLSEAIRYYTQALTVYTRQAFPEQWAETMNNLANVYSARCSFLSGDERAKSLEQAIRGYQQALEVFTPMTWPQRRRNFAYSLGGLLYNEGRFDEAREAFVTAHEAVEALRGEVQREAGRRELGEQNADLYAALVFCCLHDGDEAAAFEMAVAGKGRAFVDMLGSARFDLFAAEADDPALAADLQAYRELRQQIDNLRTRLMGRGTGINEQRRKQEWELLRNLQEQELERWEDLTYKYPRLTATQSAPSLSVKEAQALASDLGATLVEFVQHAGGSSAFVVTPQAVRHVWLNEMNQEFWEKMMDDWLNKVTQPKFHTDESYYTLDEWYDVLIAPLNLPPGGKIVLAPGNVLHLIPLSIARNPETERYLCDDYQITFTPSLAALRVSHLEAKKAHQSTSGSLQSLLSAAYAGMPEWQTHANKEVRNQYLDHAIPEVKAIATYFPFVTSLHADQATPQAVIGCAKGQDVIHFSCHGHFNPELPEQSGLALSGGWLTIQRIITELRLTQTRLVTLSACQTHRIRPNAGEEHTGLVQAFMSAGAKCVVASLWKVPEEPTRLLFEQFYRAVAAGEPPASALQKAMQVVRQEKDSDGNEIWEHPYYWAAFQVSGLG